MKRKTDSGSKIRRIVLTAFIMAVAISFAGFAQEAPVPEPGPVTPPPAAQQEPAPGLQQQPPESLEVSDEELRRFAAAVAEVQQIQLRMQGEIEGAITESDLSRERFVEIFESSRTQGAQDTSDVTESEQQEFDSLVEAIAALQMSSQQSMIEAVRETGMELERFNQILAAVQSDPSLMERLQPHLEKSGQS